MARFMARYKKLKINMKAPYYQIINGMKELVPGKAIQFDNGVYVTDNPEEIEFIRNYKMFGKWVFESVSVKDIVSKSVNQLSEYVMKVTDANHLKELLKAEKAGQNRTSAIKLIKEQYAKLIDEELGIAETPAEAGAKTE